MSFIPTILLIGGKSSGKSSFLNAFAHGYVAHTSLVNESTITTHYEFNTSKTFNDLKNVSDKICKINNESPNFIKYALPSSQLSQNVNIIDCSNDMWNNYLLKMIILDGVSLSLRMQSHSEGELNAAPSPRRLPPSEGGGGVKTDEIHNDHTLLQQQIHTTNLIIYTIDVTKQFTTIDTLTKIKKLIHDEFINNYHHIELIIIINKYDDNDDIELKQNYDKILQHVDKIKTFRVCSHKLLLSNIINNKSSLYVPHSLKPKVQKIFKNTHNLNSIDKLSLTSQSGSVTINHTDITINDNGDTDNLMTYLKNFTDTYKTSFTNMFVLKINEIINDIIKIHNTQYVYRFERYQRAPKLPCNCRHTFEIWCHCTYFCTECVCKFDKFPQLITQEVNNVNKIIKLYEALHIPLNFTHLLLQMCKTLIQTSMEHDLISYRYLIIEMLFVIINDYNFRRDILDCILNGITINKVDYKLITKNDGISDDRNIVKNNVDIKISDITIFSLLYTIKDTTLFTSFCNSKCGSILIFKMLKQEYFFREKTKFSGTLSEHYYCDGRLLHKNFNHLNMPHRSWIISMFLESQFTPNSLKYVVALSTISTSVLRQFYVDNNINKELLNNIEPRLYDMLKIKVNIFSGYGEPLHEVVFNLDSDNELKEEYVKYIKAKDVLGKIC